ncbi:SCO family protein [bacterium]|nr:SCO family protein [bacterium]
MRAVSALVLCALLAACGATPEPEPAAEAALPADVPPLRDFGGIGGDFALTDQRGAPFALQSLRGRAAMLFFGYTYCPDICPVTLSKMGRVYQLLGERESELATLFVTVDPERDTAEKLSEYLDYFAIDAIGLGGSKEQIDEVIGQYGGHYSLDREEGQVADYLVDHSTYTYLIDQQGRVRFLFRQSDGPELMAAVTQQLFAE